MFRHSLLQALLRAKNPAPAHYTHSTLRQGRLGKLSHRALRGGALLLLFGLNLGLNAGSILREVWSDIPGTAISQLTSDPRYPNQPTESNLVTDLFESPTDIAENYGQRMHGYVIPPVTGDYTFWIATDDGGELWLSTDENPATQRRIANVDGWTSSRQWEREPNQRSIPIRLEANRPYYIAALQKEGGGGDNLAVRWLRPDGADEGPIPATYLLPWGTSFTPPKLVQQPASTSAVEGQVATFSVQVDPMSPATVQWQKNQVNLPAGTNLTLQYGPVQMTDHAARFRAVLNNQLGSTVSQEATLSVSADVTAPRVDAVLNLSTTSVRITFNEPVEESSATNPGNYQLSSGANVTGASFLGDTRTILLTTTAMIYGTPYTLAVSNVRDRAASPNTVPPGTTATFLAVEYVPADIGAAAGSTTIVPDGFNLTAAGAGIRGTADEGHFAYQERTGDFDMRVRVAALSISDPFVQAGLMVRESLAPAARFAGVFASSAQLGCFVSQRTAVGPAQTSTATGGFPANYPECWLRLRRSGNQFTGYGSFDGAAWQQLGTVTATLPSKLLFGMTVASQNTNRTATAQFRDLGPAANPTSFVYVPGREPLGPSNRRTGLVFSELMYNPPARADGRDLEFIELYNAESVFVDLTGWRLTGAVEYWFPAGFILQAGQFVVVAADPEAVKAVYGIEEVLGPYSGRLNNAGDTLRLLNAAGAMRLRVTYLPSAPWPAAADGLGHSLVLSRPSYGEEDARAWGASERVGGSPGHVEPLTANRWAGVVINEFLAHTDDPVLDFIELYNATTAPVDISGCFLSDNLRTNKFRIADGTVLPARGFASFDQNQLGFALSSGGETIYLLSSDQTRVVDAISFGGQENGVSTGRAPDGAPALRRLSNPTPGGVNAPWRLEDVVINEIMYHPLSEDDADQYVELHNASARSVDLSNWRFTSGIDYRFPAGAAIPAGGYVVVAKDAARLRSYHTALNSDNTFGDFKGALSRSGDRLELAKHDTVLSTNRDGLLETNSIRIVVCEVTYRDGGRWPELADGGGSSLELIDSRSDLLRPSNWAASDETSKAPWTPVEVTGRADLGNRGYQANRLQILMQGAGECLVDDVEIFRAGGPNLLANGGFENGTTGWSFFGNHRGSKLQTTGAFAGQGCLRVSAPGDGDTANNAIRASLTSTLPTTNQLTTIRAKVRWLAGWPEVLFRVRGNWIELSARMDVPRNLGTPGLPNSRRVSNAGPAIFDVAHSPALPRANQPVIVTCRVSDPDGVAAPRLRFRIDPASTLTTVSMRDDGTAGDALAGDGIFSAVITARPAGTLVAFRIEASDDAASAAASVFPVDAPTRECLIRWEDPVPFGTFAHYHMWSTTASEQARNSSRALDNTYRDCTLVYGNSRIIYNAGFRDKGSPYHGGAGDFAVTVPRDEMLLGTDDRVFGSTGNGGSEATGMRGDVSAWIGQELGIPFLHSHYMRLYRNGGQFREILYDLEQPNRDFARAWFGGGDPGDELYKIAVWFEFSDDNSGFQATGATLERFLSEGAFKLARYRWNWQIRPSSGTANNYQSIFNLATAANNSSDRVTGLMNLADMEQWMRVFAYNRILGNWDAWTFNVGQNMFIYTPLGRRAVLMPWDIDFVLGDGNGPADGLWGGQDPVANQLYNVPAYRRMLWRSYLDAVNGPLRPEKYQPQIDARRAMLLNNGVTGLADPRAIRTYIDARRTFLQNQIKAADAPAFAITSNGGNDFTTNKPMATLAGTAPFAVATIEVNGIPYPVVWTSFNAWSLAVPLSGGTNPLQLTGRDLRGQPVPEASASVTVRNTGAVPEARDWVVINEIMYDAAAPSAEFLELHNRHPSVAFDLSGCQLSGIGFTFPTGSIIAANGYLVLAQNRAGFAAAYGATIPVAAEFSGRLDNGGEMLRLIRADPATGQEITIDDVRYDSKPPWPAAADGLGPSLQLIDAAQDNWRVGNWTTATSATDRATPGRANATRNSIEPFPPLWINEIVPNNQTGAVDNHGEREPWIELHNSGAAPLDLNGYYLSDDPESLTRWQFPPGTSLGAGQYLLIWADGQPGQSTTGSLHASFRLNTTNGVVTLSRMQLGSPAVMDYLRYAVASADRSFGSIPDGEPRKRRQMLIPTPGAANNPASPAVPVFVNEWMASNRAAFSDPADAKFDDWFELFNAGAQAVDLSGYYLTANLTNKTQFRIPDGTILAPGSFRVVWADDEVDQNLPGGDVHTNFKLPAEGGQIGLFGLDGALVDGVAFGPQTPDVSEGRFPDGSAPPFLAFAMATPGTPNTAHSANRPPVIEPIGDQVVLEGQSLQMQIRASDMDTPAQALQFELTEAPQGMAIHPATGTLTWTPRLDQSPGAYAVTVRVTDNGSPPRSASRSFQVTLSQLNRPPVLAAIPDATIDENVLFAFQVHATDPNLPPQKLVYSLPDDAPAGAGINSITGEFAWTPTEDQGPGSYSIVVRVTDDGLPPLGSERSFTVVVREANDPPLITEVPAQSIDEDTTLRIAIEARDPDSPPALLTYALASGPAGASVDPISGVFTWTPGEPEGPRDYNVTIRVSEPGGTPSSTVSFVIGVREVNVAPVLEPVRAITLGPGDSLILANHASDSDLPPQTLVYSAASPLPPGANLDPATGVLSWPIPADPAAGTNWITLRVTDDGTPPLSAEQSIQIVVVAPPRIAINEIMHRPSAGNTEFVELMNYSTANSVDLSGWTLEGYGYVFPSGTVLEPNSYLCVARDLAAFRTAYGTQARAAGNAVLSLPAEGGLVRLLKRAVGSAPAEIADESYFLLRAPWPAAAQQGASLQLIDPNQDRRRIGNWASSSGLVTNAPVAVIPMEGAWKYWQNETSPAATWNTLAFNDSAWPSSAALFYAETAELPAAKKTPLTLGRTTYYFRTRFDCEGNPDGARLRLSPVVDDGAVYYLNGQEVFRLGMPEGVITSSTFSTRTVGDAAVEGPWEVSATGLRAGENVLAVEVHQVNAGSSDVVFGTAVELITIGAASFTPGARNSVATELPACPPVWINEVLPWNTTGALDNAGDRDPWIELYNDGPEAVSLAEWSLTDDFGALAKWSFPASATVPGRGFLVIWADGEPAESIAGVPHTSFRLPLPTGAVTLARLQQGIRVVADCVEYNLSGPDQSIGSAPDGASFQKQSLARPTPGVANSAALVSAPALALRTESGSLTITWNTVAGRKYSVQVTSTLSPPGWQTVRETLADGSPVAFQETISATNSSRYYRVLAD